MFAPGGDGGGVGGGVGGGEWRVMKKIRALAAGGRGGGGRRRRKENLLLSEGKDNLILFFHTLFTYSFISNVLEKCLNQ